MRLSRRRLVPLLLLGFIALVSISLAAIGDEKDAYTVKNFQVKDVPADDGTGLVLSWTPLPPERRIIEYRIYRGIDPHRLFFLSSIPVNVKTGVASDTMYYYDSSQDEFINLKSPAKLKREKQQSINSPIYRNPPRDIKILAELAPHFNLLAVMDKNQFYYHTQKSFSADPQDSSAYAGLKLYQTVIRAGLKPGEKYYYTVIAVDERSTYHAYAPIQASVPKENPPDPAPSFYAVYLQDKQKLQFEWEDPLFKDDLAQYQVLLLPNISEAEWVAKKDLPSLGGLQVMPIASGYAGYIDYAIVDTKELMAMGLTEGRIKNAKYCLMLSDGAGFASYSQIVAPKLASSSDLPPKPVFRVIDKPNDKGDRLTIIWSNPVVVITKVSFTSGKNNRMKINYMLNAYETQKVSNIYFDFYKKGESKPFKSINEFYPDNIIMLNVPEDYNIKNGLTVVMKMKCHPAIENGYCLRQELNWDDQILSLNPGNLYSNGNNLFTLQNKIYQKPPSFPIFYQAKKMSSYDCSMEVPIPYEAQLYRSVTGVNIVENGYLYTYGGDKVYKRKLTDKDPSESLVLTDGNIDLMVDPTTKKVIKTSIYAAEGKASHIQKLKDAKEKISALEAQIAALASQRTNPEAATMLAQAQAQLEDAKATLQSLNNPMLMKVNAIQSDHARMRLIAQTREKDKRRATFYLVRTDGKGLFVESDFLKDKQGEYIYTAPIANWFDKTKLAALIASLIFGLFVYYFVRKARKGHDLYIRPIAGIQEIDNAIGRATEMGRPILYVMGSGSLGDISIIASLGILSQVAKKAAEYDTRLIVPCYDYIVMPVAQEVVREAHYEVGRPDTYNKNDVFYLTSVQFAYVAGVNGIMIREKVATNFFLGYFAAEALLMTETGNTVGAVQIAGSDAVTQIPFFITTCDYTLIGEELYAASAYLNREPMLLGTLKAQDYYKFLILTCIIIGAILSSLQLTQFIQLFPLK
ncbi:MAG TPA: hypothetical protein PLF50_02690 [Candidatus Cloacimonadota bacterium]|nr:hypothetical protein [Candidatus Cloacimonadota bacterium]